MIRLKRPQTMAHTQNSVERPQNRHLKPFKSRAELNGQLDPRINVGGRPKIIREECAKYLSEKDENGVTNARKMIEAAGCLAMTPNKSTINAVKMFKEFTDPMEAEQESENSSDFHMQILSGLMRLGAQMKKAREIEADVS